MPARKPVSLQSRHATKDERANRVAAEGSMRSDQALPSSPPARLNGNEVAMATWRRLMREYSKVEAVIISRLDLDLLIDYCVVTSQLEEVDKMRKVAYQVWLDFAEKRQALEEDGSTDEKVKMAIKVSNAFKTLVALDARADTKRKTLLTMRQSLYLTPRARAGSAPKEKEVPLPVDPFEEFLDTIPTFGKAAGDAR